MFSVWFSSAQSINRFFFQIHFGVKVLNTAGISGLESPQPVMPELGGPGRGASGPLHQYLEDQLTLFQPGEGRLSPPITTGPPKFFDLPASLNQ